MIIALIDDDSTTNFINKVKLEKHMPICEIIIFGNGKEALNYLKEGNKIDLAFLDLNMPIMNGMQFLKEHRKLDYSCKIDKIILFIEQKIKENFKLKNDIFLTLQKPLTEKKLELVFSKSQIIDDKIIKDLEPEVLIQALQIFKKNAIQEISDLTNKFNKNELENVKKIAHKLRGSSISVGLKEFSEIANKIENSTGDNLLKSLIADLNSYFENVLLYFEERFSI